MNVRSPRLMLVNLNKTNRRSSYANARNAYGKFTRSNPLFCCWNVVFLCCKWIHLKKNTSFELRFNQIKWTKTRKNTKWLLFRMQSSCVCLSVCVWRSMHEFGSFKPIWTRCKAQTTIEQNALCYRIDSERSNKMNGSARTFLDEEKNTHSHKSALCNIQNTKTLLIVFFLRSFAHCVRSFSAGLASIHTLFSVTFPFQLDSTRQSLFTRVYLFESFFPRANIRWPFFSPKSQTQRRRSSGEKRAHFYHNKLFNY